MDEIERWKLIPIPCYRAKCQKCGHVEYEKGSPQRVIIRLKFYGWRIVGDETWCNECTAWENDDDLEVSPK